MIRRIMPASIVACLLAAGAFGTIGVNAAQSSPYHKVTQKEGWNEYDQYYVRYTLDGRKYPNESIQSRRGGKANALKAGTWVLIACQIRQHDKITGRPTSQLYDKVGNYYYPDKYIRTFYTGRILGAPGEDGC